MVCSYNRILYSNEIEPELDTKSLNLQTLRWIKNVRQKKNLLLFNLYRFQKLALKDVFPDSESIKTKTESVCFKGWMRRNTKGHLKLAIYHYFLIWVVALYKHSLGYT